MNKFFFLCGYCLNDELKKMVIPKSTRGEIAGVCISCQGSLLTEGGWMVEIRKEVEEMSGREITVIKLRA